jgi:hypothetical protein
VGVQHLGGGDALLREPAAIGPRSLTQKDLGKWLGRHQANVFRQDMESWVNQMTWRFYETDASGAIIQNLANITNSESGRNVMPGAWVPIFPNQILGGNDWHVDTIVHPNGKTYKLAPQVYSNAVPGHRGQPDGHVRRRQCHHRQPQ